MSNKFTGITSAGSAIPVYDKDAHQALSSKLDTSAFSSVSGEFATVDDVVAAVSSKADTSAIPSLDGYATQEWVGEQGYLTEVPAGYATTEDVISATSGLQPSGDYYSASNPSGFITSGELPDPVTIAVQEGDTLDTDYDGLKIVKSTSNGNEHINLHKKSTDQWLIHGGLVPTSPGSNKYLITDNSGAMHWDNTSALAYDSAFEQSGGYITAYNGSAFKAGDELPSGVMNTSALEYNAVNEISAYNGSAIAQYGAEKQWLQHDDTIVHVANSAQWAFGVNLSAVAQLLGIDETVLWSGELSVGQTAALTENYSAFRKLEFKYRPWSTADNGQMKYEQFGTEYRNWQTLAGWMKNNLKAVFIGAYSATDNNHITLTSACFNNITATNAWANAADNYRLFEIRGIGRKEV